MTTTVTKNPKIPANDKLHNGAMVDELLFVADDEPDSVGVSPEPSTEPPPPPPPVLVVAASTRGGQLGGIGGRVPKLGVGPGLGSEYGTFEVARI